MTAITSDQPTRRRFTTAEYHRLVEVGVLHPKDHVELINGEIIHMSPIGPRHSRIASRLIRHFSKLDDRTVLTAQSPVHLDDEGEPEPDIALLKPRDDFYENALPGPDDILLLIEVADSSLRYDLNVKLDYYASHRVAEVWIIDIVRQVIHVCREPANGSFQQSAEVKGNDELAPQSFPDFKATVRTMIG